MTQYGVPGRSALSESRSPAGLGRLRVAAWISATMFSDGSAWSGVVFPSILLAFAPQGAESVHLTSNRSGVSCLLRINQGGPVLACSDCSRCCSFLPLPSLPACRPVIPIALLATAVTSLTLIGLLIILLSCLSVLLRAGTPTSPIGAETPPGPRMVLSALAQLPGSGSSVVLEARSVIRALAPGTVVVAVARTEELADRYARLGFSRGEGKRVFLVC